MVQPTGFTDPPMAPDAPDKLPRQCSNCRCFLPGESKWEYEEDYDEQEINGRIRTIKVLVWFVKCTRCGSVEKIVT